ncbi:hypothetical protein D3C78_1330950 [compost metagenome]
MHVERAAGARQISDFQLVVFTWIAVLNATAVEGEIRDLAIGDHHPAGIVVDRQLFDVGQLAGQRRPILQGDVRRGRGIGNDITQQIAVIDQHARGRHTLDLQKCAIAPQKSGAVTHLDMRVNRRQAEIIDKNRRAGFALNLRIIEH